MNRIDARLLVSFALLLISLDLINGQTVRKGDVNQATSSYLPRGCEGTEEKVKCIMTGLNSIPNLSKMSKLTDLDLSHNNITTLDFTKLPIPTLKILVLRNNSIDTILSAGSTKTINLISLDVSNNSIPNLKNFTTYKFKTLVSLNLAENLIGSIDQTTFERAAKIQNLSLALNRDLAINESALGPLTELEFLDLSDTNPSMFAGPKFLSSDLQLEELDLSGNSLKEVPIGLRNVPAIRSLKLNRNLMQSLRESDFIGRQSLEILAINNCPKLTRIEENAFFIMKNLKTLSLSFNPKLGFISADAFHPDTRRPLALDLRNNNLTSLGEVFGDAVMFSMVELNNNPWHCSCGLDWMTKMGTRYNQPLRCKTPEKYRDMEMNTFFATVDCENEDQESNIHMFMLVAFFLFLMGLLVAVTIQKSGYVRRIFWKDQFGTIYYTKASFPPETAQV